jgi:hypothetical protein
MKRFALIFLLLLVAPAVGLCGQFAKFQTGFSGAGSGPTLQQENLFGLTGSAWQTPSTYYVPGTGNPAISTSDYYDQSGVAWMRPLDLLQSACGATGASIAAARGRYAWFSSADHPGGNWVFAGTGGFRVGFSNDPGVPPASMTLIHYDAQVTAVATAATITADISNGSGGAGNILNVTAISFGQVSWAGASVSGSGFTTAAMVNNLTGQKGGIGTYSIGGSAQLVTSRTMTITQTSYGIYQNPYPVCNPDDPSFFMYVYGEGGGNGVEHEEGVIKSNDLVTWTLSDPSHVVWSFGSFGSWSSFQRVVRVGTGSWYSGGFNSFYTAGNVFGFGRWTSTDGLNWAPNLSTLFNSCIPVNTTGPVGVREPCPDNNATDITFAASEPNSIVTGGQTWTAGTTGFHATPSSPRTGSANVVRVPTDSNLNVLASPSLVTIGTYASLYPGPTTLQGASSYVEDGVAHYYANIGFPVSTPNNALVGGATYLNGGSCIEADSIFNFVGSISSNTLTVSSTPHTIGTNTRILSGTGLTGTPTITAQIDATHFTIDGSPQTVASTTLQLTTCGGLWQQGLDYYTEIIDSSAAATAAPIGVRASCASSTASLVWYNALPQQTYRLYRGPTAGSQTTLVGNFTGTTATDTGMTLNAVTYYKLVYVHNGVEQKNRVVSTWCSNSIYPEVNAHFTRVQAAGADMTTCSQTYMDTFYGWLTSNGLKNNLLFATAPEFCVIKSGSVISKIMDMGTTRLPKGGDYTPLTANTAYNATGINGKPSWDNSTNTAYGVYGGGRLNNIQRKTQITLFAAYKKPGTADFTPFITGQFGGRIMLQHASGAPGSISCLLSDATQQKNATATVAGLATDVHTASCTFDGTTWLAYSDAAAGSGQTGLVIPSPNLNPPDMLTGQVDLSTVNSIRVLASGGDGALGSVTAGTYTISSNQALASVRFQMVLDKAMSGAQETSLDALVR